MVKSPNIHALTAVTTLIAMCLLPGCKDGNTKPDEPAGQNCTAITAGPDACINGAGLAASLSFDIDCCFDVIDDRCKWKGNCQIPSTDASSWNLTFDTNNEDVVSAQALKCSRYKKLGCLANPARAEGCCLDSGGVDCKFFGEEGVKCDNSILKMSVDTSIAEAHCNATHQRSLCPEVSSKALGKFGQQCCWTSEVDQVNRGAKDGCEPPKNGLCPSDQGYNDPLLYFSKKNTVNCSQDTCSNYTTVRACKTDANPDGADCGEFEAKLFLPSRIKSMHVDARRVRNQLFCRNLVNFFHRSFKFFVLQVC